jgi:hypothetical protein
MVKLLQQFQICLIDKQWTLQYVGISTDGLPTVHQLTIHFMKLIFFHLHMKINNPIAMKKFLY